MKSFLRYCNLISPLSTEANNDLLMLLKTREFRKSEIINKEGQMCQNLYFVDEGLVKHFYYQNGKQYIVKFFCENNFFIIIDSFLNRTPAEYTTITLENTVLTFLSFSDLEELSKKHHSFETFIRKYISGVAYTTLYRFRTILNMDATERYNDFISEYGYLQQRISLGDTASYLGMSQVSLSRIRAKRKLF